MHKKEIQELKKSGMARYKAEKGSPKMKALKKMKDC